MDELDGEVDGEDGFAGLGEDWDAIERVLPDGWQEAARRTGALRRTRGFKDAATLLRVLLIHLVDGCSLRETAVRAGAGGLIKVSDVALLGRLRGSGEWFRWLAEQMSRRLSAASRDVLPGKRVCLVDATVVCEPGATGSTWRLHYMIDLDTLACEQLQVTLPAERETLTRFAVQTNDVVMADGALAHGHGIRHVVEHQGDVVVRSSLVGLPLEDAKARVLPLLPKLRKLEVGQAREWPASVRDDQGTIAVRVCAIKKSAEQTRESQDKLREVASKKGRNLQPDTLEAAAYIAVLTTLPDVPANQILEMYRHRWQIESAFKGLKSLLHLGHLKKTDPVGAKAWLQGKLFAATLIETLTAPATVSERLSPWGCLLPQAQRPALSLRQPSQRGLATGAHAAAAAGPCPGVRVETAR